MVKILEISISEHFQKCFAKMLCKNGHFQKAFLKSIFEKMLFKNGQKYFKMIIFDHFQKCFSKIVILSILTIFGGTILYENGTIFACAQNHF